jgi:hypothetical protein
MSRQFVFTLLYHFDVFFREFCDVSTINKEEWTLVKNDEKPHSENLIVPPHTEELRNSSNSDISSYIVAVSFIGGGKRSTQRKPLMYFIT